MSRLRVWAAVAALGMATLLGGCGDALYGLTKTEEAIIVNYSAHIVTKYNSYQSEGLSYVFPEEETEEPQKPQDTGTAEDGTEVQEPVLQDPVVNYPLATLDELFGQTGIKLNYVGARLTSNYTQDDYYALYPDEGKQYLVIGVDVINTGVTPTILDMLSMGPKFEVLLRGDVRAKSERTLLLEDFTVLEATLAPGETRETVILFQVPATVTSLEAMILTGSDGTGNYQIILQNE